MNEHSFVCIWIHHILPVGQGHRLACVYRAIDGCSEAALFRTWVYVFCVGVMPLQVKLNLWDYLQFINDDIFICVTSTRPLVVFSVIEKENL